MPTYRIALANLPYPNSPEHSIELAVDAIREAGAQGADIICFPEAFIPGYRGLGMMPPPPDAAFLERAWQHAKEAAREANIAVILGTERLIDGKLHISALIIDRDGNELGWQNKVQLDPSEDAIYTAGETRHVFNVGGLCFGIAICHEGFRYPETVRWAARNGAHIVFHPHYANIEEGSHRPTVFADPQNSFHEKALLCRAAENTCYVATINYASEGSPTTSAVIDPHGKLITFQPYGVPGILYAEIDTSLATGLLAKRFKPALIEY